MIKITFDTYPNGYFHGCLTLKNKKTDEKI